MLDILNNKRRQPSRLPLQGFLFAWLFLMQSCHSTSEGQSAPAHSTSDMKPLRAIPNDASRYYLLQTAIGDISVENVDNFFMEDEAESLLTH